MNQSTQSTWMYVHPFNLHISILLCKNKYHPTKQSNKKKYHILWIYSNDEGVDGFMIFLNIKYCIHKKIYWATRFWFLMCLYVWKNPPTPHVRESLTTLCISQTKICFFFTFRFTRNPQYHPIFSAQTQTHKRKLALISGVQEYKEMP